MAKVSAVSIRGVVLPKVVSIPFSEPKAPEKREKKVRAGLYPRAASTIADARNPIPAAKADSARG